MLGSAVGAVVSSTIFTSSSDSGVGLIGEVLVAHGTIANEAVRQAGSLTLLFNFVVALVALASIMPTVPKGRRCNDED